MDRDHVLDRRLDAQLPPLRRRGPARLLEQLRGAPPPVADAPVAEGRGDAHVHEDVALLGRVGRQSHPDLLELLVVPLLAQDGALEAHLALGGRARRTLPLGAPPGEHDVDRLDRPDGQAHGLVEVAAQLELARGGLDLVELRDRVRHGQPLQLGRVPLARLHRGLHTRGAW